MIVNYNPSSLFQSKIFHTNLTPEAIKKNGIHFNKLKIKEKLYKQTYDYYFENNLLWKSIYNGYFTKGQVKEQELIIEEHYGLSFSLVKRKITNNNHEYTLKIFNENRSHENLRSKHYCNEEQKGIVQSLKNKGDTYYDHFNLICDLINNHHDEIIEVEVWDNYESCFDFYYKKMLNTPI